MTNDNDKPPAPTDPAPPEVEAEPVGTALQVQESPPPEPPPPAAAGRSPGLILLAIFAAVLAIASAAYFSRSRTPAPAAAAPDAKTPAPVTIELPSAAAPDTGGAHDAPGPANPSPDKIFNDASSFKENLSEGAPAAANEGYINELPPAPHATPDGGANNALRDAAKRALEDNEAETPPTDEPEASLAPYDARALAELETDARRALAFSALAARARSGDAYTEELTAFLAEPQEKPLPAFIADRAAAGVPAAATLAARFPDYHSAALAAGRRAEASNIGARAAASLASLVNLRPSGAAKGATTAAVLSRVEAAAIVGDLEAALAEAAALRPEAAGALAPWAADARARVALETALAERERSLYARLAGGRL
jgi:hypothetical protein